MMPDIRYPTRSLLVNRRLVRAPALQIAVPNQIHVQALCFDLRNHNKPHQQKTRRRQEICFGHMAESYTRRKREGTTRGTRGTRKCALFLCFLWFLPFRVQSGEQNSRGEVENG